MASNVIQEFLVSLGFKTDKAQLNNFKSTLSGVGEGIKKLRLLATGAAAYGISRLFSSTAKAYSHLGSMAESVNADADALNKLGYVAQNSGSSVEAVNSSLSNLNRIVGEAAIGLGRGSMLFKKLGLSARDANGKVKQTTQVLEEIKNKIRGLEKSEQVAILSRLGLDSSLVKTLTEDVSSLEAEYHHLHKSLEIDTKKSIESSKIFTNNVNKISYAFKLLKDSVVLKTMPSVNRSLERFYWSMRENMPKLAEGLRPLLNVISAIGVLVGGVLMMGVRLIGKSAEGLKKLHRATNGWSTALIAVAVALKAINFILKRSPLGILMLGISLLLLAIDDFEAWRRGDKSVLNWQPFLNMLNSIADVLNYIYNMLMAIAEIPENFKKTVDLILGTHDELNKKRGAFGIQPGMEDIPNLTREELKKIKEGKSIEAPKPEIFNSIEDAASSNARMFGGFSPKSAPSITQNNNITVETRDNPQDIAQAVLSNQDDMNAMLVRDFQGNLK